MKITAMIARILLGLGFTVFGLNGFLHFLKAPMPTGLAGQFAGAMFGSSFHYFVFGVQLLSGVLLLANRFVTLATVLLGAVLANILMFHIALQPSGIAPGLIMFALWCIVAIRFRAQLRPLFAGTSTSTK